MVGNASIVYAQIISDNNSVKTRRRSESAYIRQVNFLQIFTGLGERRCPIKTKSLSRAVFENGPERYWDHDLDLLQSRDVIDDVIIRSAIGHFLLVGNWYQASISNRFRDICI